jgi:Putative metal-binding motif/Beta-propeller repeat
MFGRNFAWGWALLGGLLGLGCNGADSGPDGQGGAPPVAPDVRCVRDADCDDNLFCNGTETCDEGVCRYGKAVACSDSIDCTLDRCDEATESCVSTLPDEDGDGHDDAACTDESGESGDDCDDSDPDRFPGNQEICDDDSRDEDCDSGTIGNRDFDQDGFIDQRCCNAVVDPSTSEPEKLCGTDCDDTKGNVQPAATEVCDSLDNDCNGKTDEGLTVGLYPDGDFDGHGDSESEAEKVCPGTVGFATRPNDCDDADPEVFEGQFEICDDKDNNCDGKADEVEEQAPWFEDQDGDTFGDADSVPVFSCYRIPGRVLSQNDCQDDDKDIKPSAQELCDGLDNDCNGRADFRIGVNDFEDDDKDGKADSECPSGGPDCDDTNPGTSEGAIEVCDRSDNDCNGLVDDNATQEIWYQDDDQDGWGVIVGTALASCEPIEGRTRRFGDCDDDDDSSHPGTVEYCDGIDNDCDGTADEGAGVFCQRDNAVSTCHRGACQIFTCQPGYADNDADPDNGCEDVADPEDFVTDIECGSSPECDDGDLCNGLESCQGGFCRLGSPILCAPDETTLAGDVFVRSAQDTRGLEGIERILGSLYIQGTTFTSIPNLERLKFVGGDVVVSQNSKLASLGGIAALESVGGRISITSNGELTDADLPRLAGAGSLVVQSNPKLLELSGFGQLGRIDEIQVISNGIRFLAGFEQVTLLPGRSSASALAVLDNRLSDWTALENLTESRGVTVSLDELAELPLPRLQRSTGAFQLRGGIGREGAPVLALVRAAPAEVEGPNFEFPALVEADSVSLGIPYSTPLPSLGRIAFPALTTIRRSLWIFPPEAEVGKVEFPVLATVSSIEVSAYDQSSLETLEFPALESSESINVAFLAYDDSGGHALRGVSMPKLVEVESLAFTFQGTPGLLGIDLSSLRQAGSISMNGRSDSSVFASLGTIDLRALSTVDTSLQIRMGFVPSASSPGLRLDALSVVGTADSNNDDEPDNNGQVTLCTGVLTGTTYTYAACDFEDALGEQGFVGTFDSCGQCEPASPATLACPGRSCGDGMFATQFGTNVSDSGEAITTDARGNVYVAGFTYGTLGESTTGEVDIFVRKYAAGTQTVVWTRQFGTGGDDAPFDIVVDGQGNIYVGGYTSGSYAGTVNGVRDFYLVQLDSQGELIWSRTFGTSDSDNIKALELAPDGVYFAGFTESSFNGGQNLAPGFADAVVGQVLADSSLAWSYQFGGADHDYAEGIAADSQGNLYVTGSVAGNVLGTSQGGEDIFLGKLDPQRTWVWTRQFGTAGTDRGVELAIQGISEVPSIIVAGEAAQGISEASQATTPVVFAIRFDTSGNSYGAAEAPFEKCSDLALGPQEEILLTGPAPVAQRDFDAYLLRINSNANQVLQTQLFGSPTREYPTAAAATSNTVYMTGYTWGSLDVEGTSPDAFLAWTNLTPSASTNHVVGTFTELFDLIDQGTAKNGDTFSLTWAADTRVPAGEFEGGLITITNGEVDLSVYGQGPLPLKLFEPSDWETEGPTGALTFDGEGYPKLQLDAVTGAKTKASARLKHSRYAFRRFNRARMLLDHDLNAAAFSSGVSIELISPDWKTRIVGIHAGVDGMRISSAYWANGVEAQTGGVFLSSTPVFSGYFDLIPNTATDSGKPVTMRLVDLQGTTLGEHNAVLGGQGDWSQDQGVDYVPAFSIYRQPGTGSITVTATVIDVQPYIPGGT